MKKVILGIMMTMATSCATTMSDTVDCGKVLAKAFDHEDVRFVAAQPVGPASLGFFFEPVDESGKVRVAVLAVKGSPDDIGYSQSQPGFEVLSKHQCLHNNKTPAVVIEGLLSKN